MTQLPDSLVDVEKSLGASLLALAERGELKAGDGGRLVADAKERARKAREVDARRQLANAMRQLSMRLHAAGALYGEASDGWEAEAKVGLQRITDLATACGLFPKWNGE